MKRRALGRIPRALLALQLLVAPSASGQTDAAAAELYEKGLADMEAGRYESGCPALAESVRLDRRPGALFTLAECEGKWGKTASAHSHYEDYLSWVARMVPSEQRQQEERRRTAKAQKEKLAPRVPKVTFVPPKDLEANAAVELDGVALKTAALSIPLPIDPGAHRVVVRVGSQQAQQSFEIAEGETKSVNLTLPEVTPTPLGSASTEESPAPAARDGKPSSKGGHSAWTYVAFGVGAVGIVTGSVAGALSWKEKKTVEDNCDGSLCNREGKLAADRGKNLAGLSTVAIGIGLIATGIGTVLWINESRSQEARRRRVYPYAARANGGGVGGLEGSW